MKFVFVIFVVFAFSWILWSLLSSCGTWSPFIGRNRGPTCKCIGKIIMIGGSTGPADDSGGVYSCIGIKIPK